MIQVLARALHQGQSVMPSDRVLQSVVAEISDSISKIRTTLHPLGFVHFDLTNIVPLPHGSFARFHIWDPTLSPPDEGGSIHDHTWALKSVVLRGSLRNRNYRPLPDRDGPFEATRVSYGPENSFVPVGNYSLELESDQILREMDTYSIPSRLIHESTLLSSSAVTFVVGSPDEIAETHGPLLLNVNGRSRPGTSRREELSDAQALSLLQRFS